MSRIRDAAVSPFPMDRGIEKIVRADKAVIETGPSADISPAQSAVSSQLEKLYAMNNLEEYLMRAVSPQVQDPSLLRPARFEKSLRDAVEELVAAEESDARNARIFRRAAKLMREQASLRELVQMYRSALLKG